MKLSKKETIQRARFALKERMLKQYKKIRAAEIEIEHLEAQDHILAMALNRLQTTDLSGFTGTAEFLLAGALIKETEWESRYED